MLVELMDDDDDPPLSSGGLPAGSDEGEGEGGWEMVKWS